MSYHWDLLSRLAAAYYLILSRRMGETETFSEKRDHFYAALNKHHAEKCHKHVRNIFTIYSSTTKYRYYTLLEGFNHHDMPNNFLLLCVFLNLSISVIYELDVKISCPTFFTWSEENFIITFLSLFFPNFFTENWILHLSYFFQRLF